MVAAFAGLSVFSAVTFYIGFVYMVSWLQTADGIPPSRSLEINTFSMVVSLPVLIAAGWLSDWVGRKPLMLLASIGGVIGALPLFWLLNHPSELFAQLGRLGSSALYCCRVSITGLCPPLWWRLHLRLCAAPRWRSAITSV